MGDAVAAADTLELEFTAAVNSHQWDVAAVALAELEVYPDFTALVKPPEFEASLYSFSTQILDRVLDRPTRCSVASEEWSDRAALCFRSATWLWEQRLLLPSRYSSTAIPPMCFAAAIKVVRRVAESGDRLRLSSPVLAALIRYLSVLLKLPVPAADETLDERIDGETTVLECGVQEVVVTHMYEYLPQLYHLATQCVTVEMCDADPPLESAVITFLHRVTSTVGLPSLLQGTVRNFILPRVHAFLDRHRMLPLEALHDVVAPALFAYCVFLSASSPFIGVEDAEDGDRKKIFDGEQSVFFDCLDLFGQASAASQPRWPSCKDMVPPAVMSDCITLLSNFFTSHGDDSNALLTSEGYITERNIASLVQSCQYLNEDWQNFVFEIIQRVVDSRGIDGSPTEILQGLVLGLTSLLNTSPPATFWCRIAHTTQDCLQVAERVPFPAATILQLSSINWFQYCVADHAAPQADELKCILSLSSACAELVESSSFDHQAIERVANAWILQLAAFVETFDFDVGRGVALDIMGRLAECALRTVPSLSSDMWTRCIDCVRSTIRGEDRPSSIVISSSTTLLSKVICGTQAEAGLHVREEEVFAFLVQLLQLFANRANIGEDEEQQLQGIIDCLDGLVRRVGIFTLGAVGMSEVLVALDNVVGYTPFVSRATLLTVLFGLLVHWSPYGETVRRRLEALHAHLKGASSGPDEEVLKWAQSQLARLVVPYDLTPVLRRASLHSLARVASRVERLESEPCLAANLSWFVRMVQVDQQA